MTDDTYIYKVMVCLTGQLLLPVKHLPELWRCAPKKDYVPTIIVVEFPLFIVMFYIVNQNTYSEKCEINN